MRSSAVAGEVSLESLPPSIVTAGAVFSSLIASVTFHVQVLLVGASLNIKGVAKINPAHCGLVEVGKANA